MLLNLLEGKELPVYGDGLHVRDWLHVDDHAEALWSIVRGGRAGETYNVGGAGERTNLELIQLLAGSVAAETGKTTAELEALIRFVEDRPGHDRRYAIDSGKLREGLGWSPRYELPAGLAASVRWYLANSAWLARVRTGAYRAWMATNYEQR